DRVRAAAGPIDGTEPEAGRGQGEGTEVLLRGRVREVQQPRVQGPQRHLRDDHDERRDPRPDQRRRLDGRAAAGDAAAGRAVAALNEEEAQQKIKQMGYFVTKLTAVGTAKGGKGKKAGPKKRKKSRTFTIGGVSNKQLTTFTRQFSTLQDAGLPVLRSLKILEGQMKRGVLKNALIDVVEDVESGSTLSEAFSKHPKCFDRLYVNMVKAGEAGGALEVILKRLADFKEKAQTLKRKVTGAMVYPTVVILVALLILSFIMVFIIPKFEKIFKDFKMKLPALTEGLMATSRWFSNYWYVLPLFPLGFYLLLKLVRMNKTGSYALDRTYLWLP